MTYLDWREAFEDALDARLFTVEHLDRMLAEGRAQFFADEDAAIVTELKQYPTGAKVVAGVVAAGNLDGIERLIEQAEAFGKAQGCEFGMIESRPGWARRMRGRGYDTFQVSVIKEI